MPEKAERRYAMFVDIALKAIIVQLVYAAVIILIDKCAEKGKKNKGQGGREA